VRWAADAILAGASLNSIATTWNEKNVPTSTGAKWAGPEVRSMMVRPRNAGIIRHRGQEAGPARWPALLDEPLWRSVVAVLSDPSRRTSPGNERKYLGTGIYECGLCPQPNSVRTITSNRQGARHELAYGCRVSKHVVRKAEPVDAYVQTLVLDRLSRADVAELLAAREDPVDVRGAQRDMREARETLDMLAEQLGAGDMDVQEWRVARKSARERLEKAEHILARAVEVNPVAGLIGADDVDAEWERLDLSRKRAVVSYLMSVRLLPARRGRIPGGGYFDADSVEVTWK